MVGNDWEVVDNEWLVVGNECMMVGNDWNGRWLVMSGWDG